jgi:hypothetical protein
MAYNIAECVGWWQAWVIVCTDCHQMVETIAEKVEFLVCLCHINAGVAQSVECLTTDWMTNQSQAEATDFSSSFCVQTRSEAHPASYPLGTGVKRDQGMTLTLTPV